MFEKKAKLFGNQPIEFPDSINENRESSGNFLLEALQFFT
jgi:hypothetical protein